MSCQVTLAAPHPEAASPAYRCHRLLLPCLPGEVYSVLSPGPCSAGAGGGSSLNHLPLAAQFGGFSSHFHRSICPAMQTKDAFHPACPGANPPERSACPASLGGLGQGVKLPRSTAPQISPSLPHRWRMPACSLLPAVKAPGSRERDALTATTSCRRKASLAVPGEVGDLGHAGSPWRGR